MNGGAGGMPNVGGGGGMSNVGGAGGMGGSGGCEPGTKKFCYSGPAGTEVVGLCRAGLSTCLADGTGYGPCEGEIVPTAETCATPGDDDCDGQVNEDGPGCGCTPNSMIACYSGPANTKDVGNCQSGMQTCNASGTGYGPCVGEVLPQVETCMQLGDEDCDGQVNEEGAGCTCVPNSTMACYSGPANTKDVGDCHAGTQTCNAQGTGFGPCTGEVIPQEETCMQFGDEDCDGQINEGGLGCICVPNSTTTCYTGPMGTLGVGICQGGMQACNAQGTAYGPCAGEVTPQAETCMTATDDDCDGMINESGTGCVCTPNMTSACYSGPMGTQGVGICREGTHACNAQGTAFGPCNGEITPQTETCTNLTDDDCDGQINESGAGCVCLPNSVASCYSGPMGTSGVGICRAGTQTCNAQGTAYGPCTGEILPQAETCTNLTDDDCDGQINESGMGCVCLPNSTAPCYSGPTGTSGVGVCHGGTQTCNAQGTAYGACAGEVVPQQESCGNITDDDCDGLTDESCTWIYGYGDAPDQDITDIAVDAQGNSYLIGTFNGTIDLGCGLLQTPNVSSDMFVAKFDSNGVCVWSNRYGANGTDAGRSIAVDATGNIVMTGVFQSTVDFGGGPYVSVSGTSDIILLKLSPMGAHIWSKPFGATGGDDGSAVTIDSEGNIVLVGHFRFNVDFGGGVLTSAGLDDVFAAKYTPDGTHMWSQRWGDTNDQAMRSVTTDAAGNVYFSGAFTGDVDFGGGTFINGGLAGTQDGMIVKLSSSGTYQWSRQLAGVGAQIAHGVDIDGNGDLLVTGTYQSPTDFGLGSVASAGSGDIFVAKYSSNNVPQWVKTFGDTADQVGFAVDIDSQNNVLVTGRANGNVDFGGGVLPGAGGNDVFVLKLDAAGTHVWSKRGGDSLEQWGRSIATDSLRNVYVVGRFQGTMSFGMGSITSAGGYDGFFAKFSP